MNKRSEFSYTIPNCWGILITYNWRPVEEAPEPLVESVLFHPAPKHAASEDQIRVILRKHPVAPPDIQTVVDQLVIRIPEA